MPVPDSVMKFADLVAETRVSGISINACSPAVKGTPGICTTSRIQYNMKDFQLLARTQEYSFKITPTNTLEVSLQLYENTSGYFRLFAYCQGGMLFSVNLSLGNQHDGTIVLQQRLRLSTRGITSEQRLSAALELAAHLSRLGFDVDAERQLVLGTFDGVKGEFIDTTAKAFVHDFVVASVLKGHYMANKGYRLPGLTQVTPTVVE